MSGDTLSFSDQFNILGQRVRIRTSKLAVAQLLRTNFGAFTANEGNLAADLDYTVTGPQPFKVQRTGRSAIARAADAGDLLYEVEKDIVIELQRRSPQLFFVHSGAIAWQGRASLFVAESGGGKSTTTWAMLHHGYGYLSDEIAPIALDDLQVHPYPHALCLKRLPPSYPLPAMTMRLNRTLHVPAHELPAPIVGEPCLLDAIFLLAHDPTATEPSLRRLTAAEAAARLFVHALNALAHSDGGLDAALHVASNARCFALTTAALPETCELVGSVLKQAFKAKQPGGTADSV